MPGEGVSRANPTVLLWQPPQTGLGLRTKAGWGMAGRWAKTALHYSHPEEKHSPGSFPDSGCSSTLQLGPWTCLFMPRTSRCSLSPRSESQEQTGSPLPRLFRSIAFPSLPPVSKTQLPNSESYFPTLRKEGMPTHRKASVVQSHPARKPRWEAAGHLLVREETTISWAPWTRPTLGCISHLHTINLAATAVQTPLQGWPLAAEAGGGEEPGLEAFLSLRRPQGHCQSGHISVLSFPWYKLRQDHFLDQAVLWGIVLLADIGKAGAVDAVSFQIQLEALEQHPMPCLPLRTWLANLEPTALLPGLLLLREHLRQPAPPCLLKACSQENTSTS